MSGFLGVDVDGVLVDTINLYKQCSSSFEDPLDFWRNENLYDNLTPMEGSVEKLESLSEYFNIVFISRLKGNHHRSKVYWLKKHFPFMTAFVGTHEKWVMNDSVVAMIDDLEDNLVKFDPQKRVLFGGDAFPNWNSLSIKDFCKEYLN